MSLLIRPTTTIKLSQDPVNNSYALVISLANAATNKHMCQFVDVTGCWCSQQPLAREDDIISVFLIIVHMATLVTLQKSHHFAVVYMTMHDNMFSK